MKQWLLVLIVLVTALHPLYAEDAQTWANNETAWNVIRERLFNGENSKAYRFEDDIRLQVDGAKTHQDSAVFVQLVAELNMLLETVQVKLVNAEPNFYLLIGKSEGEMLVYDWLNLEEGSNITKIMLLLQFPGSYTDNVSVNKIYYYTIRKLTKLFTPQSDPTLYGGIFDVSKPTYAELSDIDKDIIKQLYSHDFYKNLKENTVKERSYLYYLDLRYRTLIKGLSYTFDALLLLFGFMFFLSRESKRKQNPSLLQYIKQRAVILLLLPFFMIPFTDIPPLRLANLIPGLIEAFWVIIGYGMVVIVVLYYIEPLFLKRIRSFMGKQFVVFFITTIVAIVIPLVFIVLFILYCHIAVQLGFIINPKTFWSENSTIFFMIVFIAALRVFYNVIQYRIQSMVNQKDVEIAKMKELKNQAELNALHSRINPHFLYNALNSIASLAHIDADKTENMALGLSELFRYSINKENKTFVTVDEELEMVNKYLDIEKTRFGDRLVYEIHVDDSIREQQIPKFLIQPLVENAVKHGLSKIIEKGRIVVEVKQHKKDLIIAIYDNGPDFPAEPVSGYGLQNLHDKLSIIYGDNASFNWVNGADKHVTITLKHAVES